MAGAPEYVVVAGLSGAGRSTAANTLEDLGWFVIDNLPPSLIPSVADLMATHGGAGTGPTGTGRAGASPARLALVAGTRDYHEDLVPTLERLRGSGVRLRVVFLDASTEVLVRRFDDTKRQHPLHAAAPESLLDAIELERSLLDPVRLQSDLVIDTGDLNVHELRDRLREAFGDDGAEPTMRTAVMSFGYKHGVPRDADLVFDCRFLPNPHWQPPLRPLTGRDEQVRDYVLTQPLAEQFLSQLMPLLTSLMPAYAAEGRAYLTIALGCTGGRHRSVALAEEVARRLSAEGHTLHCRHRDLDH